MPLLLGFKHVHAGTQGQRNIYSPGFIKALIQIAGKDVVSQTLKMPLETPRDISRCIRAISQGDNREESRALILPLLKRMVQGLLMLSPDRNPTAENSSKLSQMNLDSIAQWFRTGEKSFLVRTELSVPPIRSQLVSLKKEQIDYVEKMFQEQQAYASPGSSTNIVRALAELIELGLAYERHFDGDLWESIEEATKSREKNKFGRSLGISPQARDWMGRRLHEMRMSAPERFFDDFDVIRAYLVHGIAFRESFKNIVGEGGQEIIISRLPKTVLDSWLHYLSKFKTLYPGLPIHDGEEGGATLRFFLHLGINAYLKDQSLEAAPMAEPNQGATIRFEVSPQVVEAVHQMQSVPRASDAEEITEGEIFKRLIEKGIRVWTAKVGTESIDSFDSKKR